MSPGAVAADVVDADVEHVGALADLLGGHPRAAVPVLGQHGVAEGLRAVGVGALADDQEAQVLLDGDRRVDRRDARLVGRRAAGRLQVLAPPRPRRRGARASCRSSRRRCRCRGRRRGGGGSAASSASVQVVVGAAVDDAGQAGVGQHADRAPGCAGTGSGGAPASRPGPVAQLMPSTSGFMRQQRRQRRRRSRSRPACDRSSRSSPAPATAPAGPRPSWPAGRRPSRPWPAAGPCRSR